MKNFKVISRGADRVLHVSVVSYSERAADAEVKRRQAPGVVVRVVPVAVGGDVLDSVLEEIRQAAA
ncbi:hypothetical protein [Streptomyces sp. RK9]|uniref:hypothetical protein n=1 Tax=Streptomyces sp. RK9 TaxID=3239284 RepID=UPI00386652F1